MNYPTLRFRLEGGEFCQICEKIFQLASLAKGKEKRVKGKSAKVSRAIEESSARQHTQPENRGRRTSSRGRG